MTATYAAALAGCMAFSFFAGMLGGWIARLSRKQGMVYGLALALITLTSGLLTRATYP